MTNRDIFKKTYSEKLKYCRENYPVQYCWPIEDLPLVTERMLSALDRGSFNKDSIAFKMTCKELKIKHTYKAIKEFINE